MGGAADEVEIFEQGGADRRTQKGAFHPVRGPTVKRSTDGSVAPFKVGGRNALLVDNFGLETGQELLIQNPDDLVRIFRGFLGPVDGGGVSWRVD